MTRFGLEIRAAQPADAPAVAELLALAGHTVPAATLALRLAAIRQGAGTALLALEWGPPSGIIVVDWRPTLLADDLAARITTLLVAPAERRRGIGRLLVKAGAQAARLAGGGTLAVTPGADSAEGAAFLLATGFEQRGALLLRGLRKHAAP